MSNTIYTKKFHYIYIITEISTNMKYIGARSTKLEPIKDLGIKYFSSSTNKEFIKNQKINSSNYKYEVLSIHNTREEAIELEIKLHNKFNVGINESFYNRAKQSSLGFDTSGIKYSDERKERITSSSIIWMLHEGRIRLSILLSWRNSTRFL